MKGKIRKCDEGPEFKSFWSLWQPHMRQTDGRGLARETFYRHVSEGADPQDIVDGAAWFIRTLKDKAFIPLASTWINRQSFEDLAEQERGYQKRIQERPSQNTNVVRIASLPSHHFLNRNSA